MSANDLWDFIAEVRSNGIAVDDDDLIKAREAQWRAAYAEKAQAESLQHAFRAGTPWTDEDNKLLGMKHMTMIERAKALGRTYQSVRTQHAKLSREGNL